MTTQATFTAAQLATNYSLYMDGFKEEHTGTLSHFINVWGMDAVNSFINKTGHWMTRFAPVTNS